MTPPASTDDKPPNHPIVDEAMRCLKKGKKGYDVDKPKLGRLTARLASMSDSPELPHAVESLATFAHFIKTKKDSDSACRALMDVACSAIPALNAQKTREANRVADAVEKFRKFQASSPRLTAPKVGEATPSGSIKLGALSAKHPRRL